jgi:hypothetical protein
LVLDGPLLRRLPRGVRLVAGLVLRLGFAATTRFEPWVLRACAMATCSMLALSVGRPTAGLRTFGPANVL